MTLGGGIRKLRKKRGLTQEQLITRLQHVRGMNQSRLSQIESRPECSPSAVQLEHIIAALEATDLEATALRGLAKDSAVKRPALESVA